MNRSTVKKRLVFYVTAQDNLAYRRAMLRRDVIAWKERGATIVEIAQTLGWSRQAVYDLIGKSD